MASMLRFQARAALAGFLLIALFALGCGDDDPGDPASPEAPANPGEDSAGLSVVLDAETVAPGDDLEARVLNETDDEFIYGAGYELEREVDGEFEVVPGPPRAVIQIALIAKPGEQGPPVSVKIPKDAEPGIWRVVLVRGLPEVGDLAAEFEVTGG